MATPRDIRRLALQALYQLDLRGEGDADHIREAVLGDSDLGDRYRAPDRRRAFDLALAAYRAREDADAVVRRLSPDWAPERMPAVDRALLRLAHYEMTSGRTPPKVAVNEAVELAKVFSTERSPAFLNGVLDKILKEVLRGAGGSPEASADDPAAAAAPERPAPPAPERNH